MKRTDMALRKISTEILVCTFELIFFSQHIGLSSLWYNRRNFGIIFLSVLNFRDHFSDSVLLQTRKETKFFFFPASSTTSSFLFKSFTQSACNFLSPHYNQHARQNHPHQRQLLAAGFLSIKTTRSKIISRVPNVCSPDINPMYLWRKATLS